MSDYFNGIAASDAAKKLSANKNALEALAGTADGIAAQDFAKQNEGAIKSAVESGDPKELSRLLSSFLSTEAGGSIAAKLQELIK